MHLICGINPVLEALHAGTRHFERLLVVKGLRNRRINEAVAAASRLGVPLRFEARETLERLSDGVPHQGIMAVVSPKPVLDLDALLVQARVPALLVVLDGVEDPRNLGAILRTSEAAGADGVVIPERHSAGLNETVARASAGALEYVKVARVGNLAQALEALKAKGVWVVGFDASGHERWDGVDLKRPVALVLGGEGRGIRRLVREKCDHLVSLPLFGHVGSLNVSVAAGIALYEAVRQRGNVPSHVRPIPLKPGAAASGIVGPRADDDEHDPGHYKTRARSQSDWEAAGEAPDEPADIVHIEGDDTAWGQGATLVRGGVHRRGRWGREGAGGDKRRFKRGRKDGRGEQAPRRGERSERPERGEQAARVERPSAEAAAPPAAQEPRREEPGGRRKRRRRPRPGGGPERGAPAPNAETPREHARAAGDAESQRRRGRRRRRHRRPGPPAGGAPPGTA